MGTILNLIAIAAYIIICYFWNKVIKQRDKQITELFEQILSERLTNDINTAWCLNMVKNDAIRREDFETAAKCRNLIDEVEKRIKTYK